MWIVNYKKIDAENVFMAKLQKSHPAIGDIMNYNGKRYRIVSLEFTNFNETLSIIEPC